MKLDDKIKKQELLIEGLIEDVDKMLLGEGLYDVWSFIRNPQFYLGKEVIKKTLSAATKELEEKQEQKDLEDTKEGIKTLIDEINKLKSLISRLKDFKLNGLDFKELWIEFKGETKLFVPDFKPGFNRTLMGTKKFTVVGVDFDKKYIELKDDSFGRKSILRLHYKTLDTYVDQQGDAMLIYSRYGDPDMKPVKGDEKSVKYRITKKQ